MSEPVVAQKKPCVVELEANASYWWCVCGRSANQPFCDGSHAGTAFEPLEFTVQETKKYGLCACKHTQNAPFCDATHRNLP
jgi:CDGSH-type Zn-finger protein